MFRSIYRFFLLQILKYNADALNNIETETEAAKNIRWEKKSDAKHWIISKDEREYASTPNKRSTDRIFFGTLNLGGFCCCYLNTEKDRNQAFLLETYTETEEQKTQ